MKVTEYSLFDEKEAGISLFRYENEELGEAPALLVIPGGAYHMVCESTEGAPIAEAFAKKGFHTFVLHYHIQPYASTNALLDAMRAIQMIRSNAEAWKVKKDQVVVCGFSAGGHLAASLGTIANKLVFDDACEDGDDCSCESASPNAMLLCYPVITGGKYAHKNSMYQYYDKMDVSPAEEKFFSLEKNVSKETPPTFIWTTVEDVLVPPENSILFYKALVKNEVRATLHIFPRGGHGTCLGKDYPEIAAWPDLAVTFLRETCKFDL